VGPACKEEEKNTKRKKKKERGLRVCLLGYCPGLAQLGCCPFFFGSFSFSIFCPLFILGFGLNKALF
jgi:hypothetical protein